MTTILCAHCQNTIEAADVLAHEYSCNNCAAGWAPPGCRHVLMVTTPASCNNYEIERHPAGFSVVIGNDGGQHFDTLLAAFDYVYLTDYPLALAARFEKYAEDSSVTIDMDTVHADTVTICAEGIDDNNRPVTITAKLCPPEDTPDGLGFTDHEISTDYDAEEAAFMATLDGAQKGIAAAVIEQMGGFETFTESAADVAAHGAMSGWSGFIYYDDTVAFTDRHFRTIRTYGSEYAEAVGADGFYSLVASFSCLDGLGLDEVAEAMHDAEYQSHTQVLNALAWFALEEAARMYDDWQDSGRP